MRREELAANGDLSPLQRAIEDRDGTSVLKDKLRSVWGQSIEQIQAQVDQPMTKVYMIDPGANLPLGQSIVIDESTSAAAVQAGNAFFESTPSLDDVSRDKVVLYLAVHSDADSRIAITSVATWGRAYQRLSELGVIGVEAQETPAEMHQQIDTLSADALKEVAESDYILNHAGPLFTSLMGYCASQFQFYPSDDQKYALVSYVVEHGLQCLNHESWNIARRSLVKSGVWPAHCLTADESLAERIQNNEFNLETESGRRAYMVAKNKLIYEKSA
jgi:hypothetical protein